MLVSLFTVHHIAILIVIILQNSLSHIVILLSGCVSDSGDLYNESAVWKENDCTTCTCKGGHAQCQAEMCAVHCAKPTNVPGQCCPVCSGELQCTMAIAFFSKYTRKRETSPSCVTAVSDGLRRNLAQ